MQCSNSNNDNFVICKELTKKNEQVFRDNPKNLINRIKNNEIDLRGEFTLLIGQSNTEFKKTISNSTKIHINKLLEKYSLTETVEIVHKLSNISKKEIYQMALEIKNGISRFFVKK